MSLPAVRACFMCGGLARQHPRAVSRNELRCPVRRFVLLPRLGPCRRRSLFFVYRNPVVVMADIAKPVAAA